MSQPGGTRVVLAVGKPPRPGTLVADVAARLRTAGLDVDVRLPHEDEHALRRGPAPALLVHRGLRPDALAVVVDLEQQGVRCCNPGPGSLVATDRGAVVRALDAAGVPVPASATSTSWSQVRAELARGPRVVKAAQDSTGRAARVVLLPGPVARPPFDGPWLTQEHVSTDGVDRKLYVTGEHVHGLLKPALLQVGGADDGRPPAEPFEPDAALTALARAGGHASGLHLFGVDVLIGPGGSVVVDVNVLPGFRGVHGAAEQVTAHLLGHLAAG